MKERYRLAAAAYVMFIRDGRVLLMRRANTSYHSGDYGLPSGHLEKDEPAITAAIREVKEEVGIRLTEDQLTAAHVMQRRQNGYFSLFFTTTNWEGEPRIMEPDKCDDLRWFPLDDLPPNIVPYISVAIAHWQTGRFFSEYGWDT